MNESLAETRLPEYPEPVEVEIELTNRCNARCTACPRDDMPLAGLLDVATLDLILDAYADARPGYTLNQPPSSMVQPRISVAGGGEPLLHPEAVALLARVVARGFPVHLITNGSLLTDERIAELLDVGLSSVCISFWGVKKDEYERAMRLPYERTLERVETFAQAASAAHLPVRVLWVRSPEIVSRRDEIAAFWSERGIAVEMGDNVMWNRGGLLQIARRPQEGLELPDPRRRIWCADLFFSDTYDWRGRCLLCCCNYFCSDSYELGDIRTHTPRDISAIKAQILSARPLPSMCVGCEQPRREQSTWLAEPWLSRISAAERAMVTYDPTWVAP